MPAMVPGIYKQGKVELLETPTGLREGRVRVMLVEDEELKPEPRYLEFGKYKGDKDTTLEDSKQTELPNKEEPKPEPRYLVRGKYPGDTPLEAFEEAEFHGEPEFDDLYGK